MLLRNIGQFDSVTYGGQLPFSRLTLLYAENGRGKTTLAAIFRSLSTGEVKLILDRRRLGATQPPHIVLKVTGGNRQFQNDNWDALLPEIAIFDDTFVAANVCSGVEISPGHRKNLHELILGAQGVMLSAELRKCVEQIEELNRTLSQKSNAIPAAVRGDLSLDSFCALPEIQDIDTEIQVAERNLAAGQSVDTIRRQNYFQVLSLPAFDTDSLATLLACSLADLEAEAAARVCDHLRGLGRGGEPWVSDGMGRIEGVSEGHDHSVCPFCAQNLEGSDLIRHYQAYFSEAYGRLLTTISKAKQGIKSTHGGAITAAFERAVRIISESRGFWKDFTKISEVSVDTAVILQSWVAARDAVLVVLSAKASAPLDRMELSPETLTALHAYDVCRSDVAALSEVLQAINPKIATIKEHAEIADLDALTATLKQLKVVKARYNEMVNGSCQDYLNVKAAKAAIETLREQARTELDNYRQNIFPAYEADINFFLQRFNAGFCLTAVKPVNIRDGSTCNYNVLINNVPVELTSDAGPAFRNTLSAGDRNTLALAFFFASLKQDPGLANKIVVIDDPMTSLDEHRSMTTVQEVLRLLPCVSQVVVMSHSKPFLCQLWESADRNARQAILIHRESTGSNLATWDVHQACITEHDRRHALVSAYMQAANPAADRQVATALRYILEAFIRVAYPAEFPPSRCLGPFLNICQQRVGLANQVLSLADIDEALEILSYANRFHHDTNPAYGKEVINDQELHQFCGRVLAFAKRA